MAKQIIRDCAEMEEWLVEKKKRKEKLDGKSENLNLMLQEVL